MTSIGLEINSNDLWSYILRGIIIIQGDYTTHVPQPFTPLTSFTDFLNETSTSAGK